MKCVRTGSAQNTAQPFGEKQRVEKMTYNCEAGCSCDRLARSQGADQVFEPWAMVLLQSATLQRLPSATLSSEWRRFHI